MVIATFVGFAFALVHPPAPDWLMLAIRMTGDAMIPLMLISLGVRMATVSWGGWNLGVIGALVCPLTGIAMSALLAPVLGLDATQAGLLILFGCLPPAVLNFMVAEQYNQEPGKVASIVLIGNGASIVFVPIALSLAGLQFSLPIGILTGLLVFIPYVGFGLGFILGMMAALLQWSGWPGFIAIVAVFPFADSAHIQTPARRRARAAQSPARKR